jgi:hypothetical protein
MRDYEAVGGKAIVQKSGRHKFGRRHALIDLKSAVGP